MAGCYSLFFFKQKTTYEMRISDWSSDVCSSDLEGIGISAQRGSDYHARLPGYAAQRACVGQHFPGYKIVRKGGQCGSVERSGNPKEHGHRENHRQDDPALVGCKAKQRCADNLQRQCERAGETRVGKECVSTLQFR